MDTFKTTDDLYENLFFGSGKIAIFNAAMIAVPTNTFVIFMEAFRSTVLDIDRLFYAIGKKEGIFLHRTFERRNVKAESEKLSFLLDFIEYAGLGHFAAVVADWKRNYFLVKSENSPIAKQYVKIGIKQKTAEAYIAGLLAGFLGQTSHKPLQAEEIGCIAQGNVNCMVKVEEGSDILEEEQVEGFIMNKAFYYDERIKPDYNAVIEKALAGRHLVLEKGEITLWNFSLLFLPVTSLLLFQKFVAAHLGAEKLALLYYIGKKQAYSGSQIQVQQYGRKNDKKLYLSMIQHHEFVGMGYGNVTLFDEAKRRVDIDSVNNTYVEYSNKLFGMVEPCNFYLCGLAAGITKAFFDENIECDETRVHSGGCTLSLYPGNKELPGDIAGLIDKNMSVKQFIL